MFLGLKLRQFVPHASATISVKFQQQKLILSGGGVTFNGGFILENWMDFFYGLIWVAIFG